MSVCCSFVSNNHTGNGQDRCAGGIRTGFRSFTRSAVKLGPTHTWTHTFCARKSKHVGLGAVKSSASPSVSLSFLTESSHTWTHLSSRRLSLPAFASIQSARTLEKSEQSKWWRAKKTKIRLLCLACSTENAMYFLRVFHRIHATFFFFPSFRVTAPHIYNFWQHTECQE